MASGSAPKSGCPTYPGLPYASLVPGCRYRTLTWVNRCSMGRARMRMGAEVVLGVGVLLLLLVWVLTLQ